MVHRMSICTYIYIFDLSLKIGHCFHPNQNPTELILLSPCPLKIKWLLLL